MCTEQHGLYCSKIIIYTVFLLLNHLELPFNSYSQAQLVCVLDSLIVWKPQSLSSEILLHHGSLFDTSNDH